MFKFKKRKYGGILRNILIAFYFSYSEMWHSISPDGWSQKKKKKTTTTTTKKKKNIVGIQRAKASKKKESDEILSKKKNNNKERLSKTI